MLISTIFPKRSAGTVSDDLLNLIRGFLVLATRQANSVEKVLEVFDGFSNGKGASLGNNKISFFILSMEFGVTMKFFLSKIDLSYAKGSSPLYDFEYPVRLGLNKFHLFSRNLFHKDTWILFHLAVRPFFG